MPTTCYVAFENRWKVFSAGQWLRGDVRLTLEEEKKVRGVFVRILGEAYASFSTGKSRYTGKEVHLDSKSYLVGGECDEVRLTPGEHFYSFQCFLPPGLPTSCEGKIGYIRYSVNVVLDVPLWLDKSFEVPFTVIKEIDLNSIPAIRGPNIVQNNHKFWLCCLMCCCPWGSVQMVVRTPVGGYTPGQTVNVDVEVNNKSNQQISKFSVKLIKEINYRNLMLERCCFPVRSKRDETITLTKKHEAGCNEYQQKTFRVDLVIPPIPPTDVSTSSIMKVQYYIQVTGSVSFCHMKPTVKLPITIGTYPIQGNGTSNTLSRNNDPPNYEEAMYLDTDGYKPSYPVFSQTPY